MLGLDTIGVKLDLEPCADPMTFSLDITESDLGIDFPIADLTAGEDEEILVPGLSISIPGVPVGAGIAMDIKIDGNIEQLDLSIGVDACANIPIIGQECGSSLVPGLPIWLLNDEFDFSDFCSRR